MSETEHKHIFYLGLEGARCECGEIRTSQQVNAIFGYPQLTPDGLVPALRPVDLDAYTDPKDSSE